MCTKTCETKIILTIHNNFFFQQSQKQYHLLMNENSNSNKKKYTNIYKTHGIVWRNHVVVKNNPLIWMQFLQRRDFDYAILFCIFCLLFVFYMRWWNKQTFKKNQWKCKKIGKKPNMATNSSACAFTIRRYIYIYLCHSIFSHYVLKKTYTNTKSNSNKNL